MCGSPWDQIDHRTPVAAGGSHDLENCQPICGPCNSRKRWDSDRDLIRAFRPEHPDLRSAA
ncbi:HNH endonuclease [Gordonia sp. NPDC057258]